MKPMKKMLAYAVFVIALFSVSSTYAQGGGRMMDTAAMRKMQEERLAKMKTDLKLTDVQADSVGAITKEFNAKRRDIFMDQSIEDKRAAMQPLNDAMNVRIKAALGADLFSKYQDWQQANRPQRRGGPGGGGPGGGGPGGNN
jgi:hypothetical protein